MGKAGSHWKDLPGVCQSCFRPLHLPVHSEAKLEGLILKTDLGRQHNSGLRSTIREQFSILEVVCVFQKNFYLRWGGKEKREKESEQERERESVCTPESSGLLSNACNAWEWAEVKARATTQVSHTVGTGTQSLEPLLCFPGSTLAGSWNQKLELGALIQLPWCGTWAS